MSDRVVVLMVAEKPSISHSIAQALCPRDQPLESTRSVSQSVSQLQVIPSIVVLVTDSVE